MKPNFLPILFAFSLTATSAEFIISPRILLNPGTSPGPFFVTPDIAPSVRWQQVYGASDFMHTPGPQFLITEISFVGGGGGASLDAILPNILINLSTTRLLPDGLSTTFSANTGPDETAVFSGPLQFTFTMETYGIHLQLQQPFLYDPSMGNLLLDVRNFQTIPPPLPFGERLFESVRGGRRHRIIGGSFGCELPLRSGHHNRFNGSIHRHSRPGASHTRAPGGWFRPAVPDRMAPSAKRARSGGFGSVGLKGDTHVAFRRTPAGPASVRGVDRAPNGRSGVERAIVRERNIE